MHMRLRDVRLAHGWSQARLVHEIVTRLKAAGRLNVSPESLKVYVSEWENGRRPVAPMYREVLRAIFGMTDEELFGTDEAEIRAPRPDTRSSSTASLEREPSTVLPWPRWRLRRTSSAPWIASSAPAPLWTRYVGTC